MSDDLHNEKPAGNETRAEQSLRVSELSYRRLFEAAQDGILILAVDTGRITDVNPFLVNLLGFSHDEMVGKTVGELSPFKDVVSNQAMLERLQKDGYVRYEDLPLKTRDGRDIAVEFVCNVYQAGDKKVIQCNIRDITERKRAEKVLHESEERFASAFEHAPIGMALVAPDDYLFKVNRAFCELLGYPEAELLTLTVHDITHHGDLEAARENMRRLRAGEIRCFEMEKRYTHKRGHIVTALTTVSLVRDGQGQPLYLIAQIQDVTERKLAKQEAFWKTTLLEAQLESSIDGILVVGTEGEQILQNRRMTELWKFPAAIVEAKDEAAQLRYATSQVKNSKPFIERVNYLYAHPDQTSQDEVELVDGTIMDRYSAPIRDQAGKYYGRIWSFRDITERRKLEQNLYQTQKLESIGQLAGGIAHDFNNILAAIVGYISLTKVAAADSPVTLGYLDHIAKASDRAIALVRQILTFSRQNKPERETVKLNVVVLEALKLLRASVPATIRIQTELTETPTVLANTSAIHQIVMNLGTNA